MIHTMLLTLLNAHVTKALSEMDSDG